MYHDRFRIAPLITPNCWRWILGCLACLACLATAGTQAAARDYQLPAMGQPSANYMSPAKAHKLGAQVVSQLLARDMIIEDPILEQYINRIGQRLARHASGDANNLHFYVIDSPQVNAFALPGGHIGVNAGLIHETTSESELAGIMAHEIAHVTQHHIARQLEATSGTGWATLAAVLAAAIIGGGDSDAVSAAVTAGMSSLGQQQINYTRANEFEADRVGIRTLAAAGFNPNAMASFFEKLQRRSRLYANQLPQILLTHPVSNTRMAEAENRAQDYPDPDIRESADYPLIKERARVLASRKLSDLKRFYERSLDKGDNSPALNYGYALTLMRLGRAAPALDRLEPLARAQPGQLVYTLALAEAQARDGHIDTARKMLDDARARFPDSPALMLAYAHALADSGDPQAVRDYLLGQPDLLDQAPDAQKMLARAAGQQQKMGEAYYRQARYHGMRGAYAKAINQLRTALQTADLDGFDKSRLRALLGQMVSACHKAWSERECRQRVKSEAQY